MQETKCLLFVFEHSFDLISVAIPDNDFVFPEYTILWGNFIIASEKTDSFLNACELALVAVEWDNDYAGDFPIESGLKLFEKSIQQFLVTMDEMLL